MNDSKKTTSKIILVSFFAKDASSKSSSLELVKISEAVWALRLVRAGRDEWRGLVEEA